MLNSKQRARLRALANGIQPISQIGKGGISDAQIKMIDDALDAHELIKMTTLESAGMTSREGADTIAQRVGADVVSVVGRKFVIFRESRNEERRIISKDILA